MILDTSKKIGQNSYLVFKIPTRVAHAEHGIRQGSSSSNNQEISPYKQVETFGVFTMLKSF